MGLLSSLTSSVKNIASNIIKATPILKTISTPLQQTVKAVASTPTQTTTSATIATKTATAITAPSTVKLAQSATTASIIGGSISVPSISSTIIKSIIPTSTSGKVAVAVAVPSVVTAVSTSPTIRKELSTGGTKILTGEYGKDVAQVVEGTKTFTEFVKENPVASSALAVGAVVGASTVVKGAVPLISSALNTRAVKENTQILKEQVTPSNQNLIKTGEIIPSKTTSLTPLTPSLTTVSETKSITTKRRTKRKVKRITQPSNKIHIDIFNQSKHLNTSKRISY